MNTFRRLIWLIGIFAACAVIASLSYTTLVFYRTYHTAYIDRGVLFGFVEFSSLMQYGVVEAVDISAGTLSIYQSDPFSDSGGFIRRVLIVTPDTTIARQALISTGLAYSGVSAMEPAALEDIRIGSRVAFMASPQLALNADKMRAFVVLFGNPI